MNLGMKALTGLIVVMSFAVAHADCEDGHWVKSVSSNGEIVVLEDGSVWQVDPIDAIDSMLWLPTTDIAVCDGMLINVDDGEKVAARRLK